jgi:hypothetical protein
MDGPSNTPIMQSGEFPIAQRAKGIPRWPTTARPRTTADFQHWNALSLALERHAQGRGPLPDLRAPLGHYVSVSIQWPALPPMLVQAFARLSEVLEWPGVLGCEPYVDTYGRPAVFRDAKGRSVEERLHALDRAYKKWHLQREALDKRARGARLSQAEKYRLRGLTEQTFAEATETLHLQIQNAIALIAMAPRSPDYVEPPRRVLTQSQRARVRAVLGKKQGAAKGDAWLDRTITRLEDARFEDAELDALIDADFDRAVSLAKWRVEWSERQYRRRHRACLRPCTPTDPDPVRVSLGGHAPTGEADRYVPPSDDVVDLQKALAELERSRKRFVSNQLEKSSCAAK